MNTLISSVADTSSVSDAKKQASRLVARLTTLGVSIKRAQALEAVAAVHNFPDWNRYQAKLTHEPGVQEPLPQPTEGQEAALADTGRALPQNHLIVLPAGFGKTTVMAMLFANAMMENKFPIWISGGAGDPMPSFPKSRRHSITKMDLHLDDSGSFSGLKNLEPLTCGVYISIHWGFFGKLTNESSARVMTEALASLLGSIHDQWNRSFQLVLVDEIPMIDPTNVALFRHSKIFRARHCQFMIGLQHLPEKATPVIAGTGFDFSLITVPEAFRPGRSDETYWSGRCVMVDPTDPREDLRAISDSNRIAEGMVRLTLQNLMGRDIDLPNTTECQQLVSEFLEHFAKLEKVKRLGHQRIVRIETPHVDLESMFIDAMRRAPDLLVLVGEDSPEAQSVMMRARTLGCDAEIRTARQESSL